MKSYDLKKEGAALRADFESMPAIAPDLWDFVIIKDWEEEFLALHQWLISGFFPLSDDSPAMITEQQRETGAAGWQGLAKDLPRGGEPAPRQMRFKQTSGIETQVTVSSVPTSVPETQDRGKTSVRQPIGTPRRSVDGLSPAMITESPKRETPVRQPSQIGRDLAPDNELTDQSVDPRRSVTGDTIRPNGGKIGTLRDLAQDINNELTDQSFDLKPAELPNPRRSVAGDTIPERPNGGNIGTFRDLSPAMITESPKRETGVPTSVPVV
ncbi:hypothetical protein THIOM_000656, partial [Candidatus Thiomargarita nelsonii]